MNPDFTRVRSAVELDGLMKDLNGRLNEFIKRLFHRPIAVSDLSYEYVRHMHELYPNHRAHADLIARALLVLCDLLTEDWLHSFLKQRQAVFFE